METKSRYKIVSDEVELVRFINWLPELQPNEIYYLTLLARNKYCKDITHIKSDREQLKRVTTPKHRMIDKILQMECPLGAYKQNTTEIPQEALALYIHPNPRNMELAAKNVLKEIVDRITAPYSNYNVHQIALSNIQNARSRRVYVHFDFDHITIDAFITEAIDKYINVDACSIIQTRGGFHLLVELSKVDVKYQNTWFVNIQHIENLESETTPTGDLLLPVPGCIQGGFIPKFVIMNGMTC